MVKRLCFRQWGDAREKTGPDVYPVPYPWTGTGPYHDEISRWIGEGVTCEKNIVSVVHFINEFANVVVSLIEHEDKSTVQMHDCQRVAAEYFNVNISFPLEKMFTIPLLCNGATMMTTLFELATARLSGGIDCFFLGEDNLSHEEQVVNARANIERHLRIMTKEKNKQYLQEYEEWEGSDYDPDETIGVDNDCDSDWEEWIASLPGERKVELTRSEEEAEKVDANIRSKLQAFIEELTLLPAEDSSTIYPQFKLCSTTFDEIWKLFKFYKCNIHLSLPFLHFFQRIVEDLIFGVAITVPVEHADFCCPLGCHLLIGEHVTMFALDENNDYWADDDSDYSFSE